MKRVLAGEKADIKGKPPSTSKSQDKENRESRAEEQKSHKDKEVGFAAFLGGNGLQLEIFWGEKYCVMELACAVV